jgi:hypothetical protein
MSDKVMITTGYSKLPSDVQSAISEINACMAVGLSSLRHPKDFKRGQEVSMKEFMKAYLLCQELMMDR